MGKIFKFISYPIIFLTILSCGISIFNNEIYQDGVWVNAQWLGQDIVSLLIATPLLLMATIFIQKDQRWLMILGGAYFYFVYVYAFFVFGAELTFLYLFHVPIFSLSLFGLFFSFREIFKPERSFYQKKDFIKYLIIAYLLINALVLSFLWFADIFGHLIDPNYRSDTPDGSAPLIIYSLDLAIVIPLMIFSVIGYWKGHNFGNKLIGIMLTKTSTIGFMLMGMSLSMYLQNLNPDISLTMLWCFIGLVGLVLSILFFKRIETFNI